VRTRAQDGGGTRLRATAVRAGRDALYLTIGLATSVLAFVVWVSGVTLTVSLAVFIVGLPVFLLSAAAFRWTAELDRRNAALALGEPLRASYRDHSGERFLTRLANTARDPQTWKDLVWLMVHSVVGFAFGMVAISAVAETIGVALLPAWYWAVPGGASEAEAVSRALDVLGIVNVDTLPEALAVAPLAIPIAAIAVGLMRVMALAHSRLAAALLGSRSPTSLDPTKSGVEATRPRRPRPDPGAVLAVHASVAALLGSIVTVIWGLTGEEYFWPGWVWLGLGILLGLHAGIRRALRVPAGPGRRLAVQGAISAVIGVALIFVWEGAESSYFWPVWPLVGLIVAYAAHYLIALLWPRLFPGARERELTERVDELTRTRRGALDVQAAELRRIERDLHDGAQARLVALTMQLGRAEEGLADQPEAAALIRQARGEASAAIAELRDLARGIAPPVLADRGLGAAVEALGRRAVIPVAVQVDLDRRPPPVLETAAYFVVAEALTNVSKHAPDAEALVRISLDDVLLTVEVADNGPGGADAEGGGLGGLRGRVEALDGSLRVISPRGSGTTIHAEMPYGNGA
jgi:signal transduction histidine kinase